ncbi:hypothetical protein ACH5RR_036481 [Cinchona calisaya]|uniref:Late blight resistance protein R1A-like N-terminal domain-containing protein n=1 Tax=Cinchona calisaya TaxID=153742 RepID=A0ABD2Y3B4_9GENT
MDSIGIDSAIEQLSKLLSLPHLTFHMKQKIQILQLDLKFVKLLICCLAKGKSADDNIEATTLEAIANIKGLYNSGYLAIIGREFKSWDLLSSNLLDKDLFCLKVDKNVVPVQKQIEAVEKKLRFSRIFVEFVAKRGSKNDNKMEDFFIHFQDWAKNYACLSLLYWVDGMDENTVRKMNVMLTKFMPYNPAIAEMYLELLKFSETSPSDSLLMGEIVASFADAILENLVVFLKDDFATLREGLLFLIAFLVDPTKESTTETGNVIDNLVKCLICSLYIYQTEDYSSKERNDLVHDLLKKIEKVKDSVNLQSDNDEDLKVLQTRIVNLAYKVEHVIDSCLVVNIPIWNHIVCFSDILEEIKCVQSQKIRLDNFSRNRGIWEMRNLKYFSSIELEMQNAHLFLFTYFCAVGSPGAVMGLYVCINENSYQDCIVSRENFLLLTLSRSKSWDHDMPYP